MAGLRLELLKCTGCGAPVAAESEDIVYYCTACRSGFRLATDRNGQEIEGLVPVEVSFVALPGAQVVRYLPFWWLSAKVNLQVREAAGGKLSGLLDFFTGGSPEAGRGDGDGGFAIPAFEAPLALRTELALRYTQALPRLGERLGEKLTGGRLTVEDAEKLAHFTLIASEAEKPDMLRNLTYTIAFGSARLLGVPFVKRGDRLADAVFGVGI